MGGTDLKPLAILTNDEDDDDDVSFASARTQFNWPYLVLTLFKHDLFELFAGLLFIVEENDDVDKVAAAVVVWWTFDDLFDAQFSRPIVFEWLGVRDILLNTFLYTLSMFITRLDDVFSAPAAAFACLGSLYRIKYTN